LYQIKGEWDGDRLSLVEVSEILCGNRTVVFDENGKAEFTNLELASRKQRSDISSGLFILGFEIIALPRRVFYYSYSQPFRIRSRQVLKAISVDSMCPISFSRLCKHSLHRITIGGCGFYRDKLCVTAKRLSPCLDDKSRVAKISLITDNVIQCELIPPAQDGTDCYICEEIHLSSDDEDVCAGIVEWKFF
jgi:hypothetical protein